MAKVAVLLSSYNGEQYIEEQIESIYKQSFKDFSLYVRDDGSSDACKELLRKLKSKYGFELFEGENLGFVGSFMWLLRNVKDANYYAFADQDDIWKEGKLKKAVDWFEKSEQEGFIRSDRPALFHSAYDVIKDDGKVIDRFFFPEDGYDFKRSITENHYSGFSMVINKPLRNLIIRGNDDKIGYHDWWAAMIVHAFGKSYSDQEVMALHRAHGDNVTTFNMLTRVKWLCTSLKEESDIHKRVCEFERCFGDKLKENDKNVLKRFCGVRYNLFAALWKCFYPRRWRPMLSSEIVIRLLMLVGRI
ncbi:MAG: glycosyltransferase [Lachnospiraceae bacterium]|nr:glycosyltransferase [Lachnospiraceae bacterium]